MASAHNLATRSPHSKTPRPKPIELRVKSLTRAGVTYRVRYANHRWECECLGFRHRNRCKHALILGFLGGPKRVTELAAIEGRSR